MQQIQHILKTYFGYESFRDGQAEIIDALITGQDVMAIMPTGAGKSLCYQVPALMLEGITLVISPLIALMKDQVTGLLQSGVPAAYLNSSQSIEEQYQVLECGKRGEYKLLYVAPEQLLTEKFISFTQEVTIPFISIDEAHCVSQWGHDFRPGYTKIADYIEQFEKRPTIAAFTATATEQVKLDIMYLLKLHEPFILTTGFDRANLYFAVKKPKDKLQELSTYIKNNFEKSGIIYCATRKEVERVYETLSDLGYNVTKYHAGLSTHERTRNQEDFVLDEKNIIIATNAFGMGIDKSNVSFVIHFNMPKNIENYYQEAGRAGRDGTPADCILYYSGKDVRTHQFFIDNAEENEALDVDIRQAFQEMEYERLKQMTFYCYTQNCLRQYILDYFGEVGTHFCDNCSNCKHNFERVDVTIPAQKIISCVKRMHENFGIVMVVDVLRGSKKARLLELGFDQLSTYGALTEYSENQLRHIIQVLLTENVLAITTGQYPVLKLGNQARAVLFNEKQMLIDIPKKEEPVVSKKQNKNTNDTISANPQLFTKLQELRRKLAIEQNVPAYIVFSNATLEAMCQQLPQTLSEMAEVSGVGKVKLEQYGQIFLDTISNFNK